MKFRFEAFHALFGTSIKIRLFNKCIFGQSMQLPVSDGRSQLTMLIFISLMKIIYIVILLFLIISFLTNIWFTSEMKLLKCT